MESKEAPGAAGEPSSEGTPDDPLRAETRQLRQLVDALPSLIAYVDTEQRYRFVNASYERWFGRPREELVGRHVGEVLGTPAYDAVRPQVERAIAGHPVTYEAEVPYAVGGLRSIEATYVPQRADDGTVEGYVSLVADISERRSFERFRLGTAERAERLLKITAAIAEAVTSTEVFEAACDHVAAAVGASSAALWLMNEDGRTARLVRSLGYTEATRQQFAELRLDAAASFPALDCLRRGEPMFLASQAELVQRYPHLASAVSAGRSYRVSCLPLAARGRSLGVVGLTIEEEREASDDERNFLMLAARYTSQAIERLRLFEAERRSREEALAAATRLELLGRASRAFVEETSLDLAATLDRVTLEVAAVLGGVVGVALLHADGRLHASCVHHPVAEARRRLQELTARAPLQLGEGVSGTVASTGESVLIASLDPTAMLERVSPAYRAYVELHPIHGLMCAPLRVRGRIIGVITACSIRAGQPYGAEDLQLLEELADRAAAAIENARLHREVVDARSHAEQLLEELHETVRYSETFAGILAHDLRSPLGAMMTAAQLLLRRQEGADDKITRPLHRIVSSGERMGRMIEQLLDLTRARVGGGIAIHPQDTNLAELCGQVMDELGLVYPEWALVREVRGDAGGAWDPDRMLQVVSNLLANAGVHGKPETGVRVRIDGTSREHVVLEVHNEGAIPDALLPSIFDPFRGTRHRQSGQSRGLGLGLFITQQIVQGHGGTMDVRSTEAEGTTFIVRLPRRSAASGKVDQSAQA